MKQEQTMPTTTGAKLATQGGNIPFSAQTFMKFTTMK